jgi:hypothetical protein
MKASKDKTTLIDNQFLNLSGIPTETYELQLNLLERLGGCTSNQ